MPAKAHNKVAIAKAFDNKSGTVNDRVRQWQEQGGGVKAAPEDLMDTDGKKRLDKPKAITDVVPVNERAGLGILTDVKRPGSDGKSAGLRQELCDDTMPTSPLSPVELELTKPKAPPGNRKNREISAARLKLAQAILGPTSRPSERLRRLSEAKKEAEHTLAFEAERKSSAGIVNKSKEVGTPKKRIISDGHWRQQRLPPKVSDPLNPALEKPNVEVWLENLATGTSASLSDDVIRVTPVSGEDAAAEAEKQCEERQKMHKERAEASGLAREGWLSSRSDGIKDCRHSSHASSPHSLVKDSKCTLSAVSDQEDRATESAISMNVRSRRPRSAPIASGEAIGCQPRRKIKHRERSTRSGSPRASSASLSSNSDQLTSISRRPPREASSKSRRNIFSHAAKLFAKPEPKLDPHSLAATGTPYVSTIESWLDHTQDPFQEARNDLPFVEIPAPYNIRSSTMKIEGNLSADQVDLNEDYHLSEYQLPRGLKSERDKFDPKVNGKLGSRRRPRRVLRHRDGRVTADEEASSVDLPDSGKLCLPSTEHAAGENPTKHADIPIKGKGTGSSSDDHKSEPMWHGVTASLISTETASSITGDHAVPNDLNIVGHTSRPIKGTGIKNRILVIPDSASGAQAQNIETESLEPRSRSKVHRNNPDILNCQTASSPTARDFSRQRRLAKHSDLLSVLSGTGRTETSIPSARSVRTYRSRLATTTTDDVLQEFANDEGKYMRELHTLVEGVIPVLLTSVLSRTDSSATAILFNPKTTKIDGNAFSKSIFDMGMVLERLKAHHQKASLHDPTTLLKWARGGFRYYTDYLRAWRLGFQDVVVNLAPEGEGELEKEIEQGLLQNDQGDIIDAYGERVDVAFLLKRPLVRLKYIAKTLRGINHTTTFSEAEEMAAKYQSLVQEARRRSNEERARLEDEAAATIDVTRVRDPQTLAPVEGVVIQADRRVRARDHFQLQLNHSSGQSLDCRVELHLRDDPINPEHTGDLLISEVDGTGRWLLFPPLCTDQVSAKDSYEEGEVIVMIRGSSGDGQEWHELMALTTEDHQAGSEWVKMLGQQPLPIVEDTKDFRERWQRQRTNPLNTTGHYSSNDIPEDPANSRIPSPPQVEVPIGERAQGSIKRWKDTSSTRMKKRSPRYSPSTILEETQSALEESDSGLVARVCTGQSELRQSCIERLERLPRSLNGVMPTIGGSQLGNRRARAQMRPESIAFQTDQPASPSSTILEVPGKLNSCQSTRPTSSIVAVPSSLSNDLSNLTPPTEKSSRMVPTRYSQRETVEILSDRREKFQRGPENVPALGTEPQENATERHGHRMTHPQPSETVSIIARKPSSCSPPQTPAQCTPPSKVLVDVSTRIIGGSGKVVYRRTSSPLKHEYALSDCSASASDSDVSGTVHDTSSLSESSSDSELEDDDAQSVLVPILAIGRYRKAPKTVPSKSLADGTLAPSQSASQAPYRDVPQQLNKTSRTVAKIFYWSDTGLWQNIWPKECTIFISPGLIEAYEPSPQQDSLGSISQIARPESRLSSDSQQKKPLISLELTPLVPIRRGTALDISIRSPPTSDSRLTMNTTNNFLFRSRNPEECEALYALINHSRINNPTYIALQNARAMSFATHFQGVDRETDWRLEKASSWFGLAVRKNSYRASSVPTTSISKQTNSSIGSLGSAFSAFRNLARSHGRFNLARSTVTCRQGSQSNSIYTSNEETGGSGMSSPSVYDDRPADGSLGLNNCKIRLYIRESTSKWADLGSARLTIMRPTNVSRTPNPIATPVDTPSPAVPKSHGGIGTTPGHGIGMAALGGYASLGNKISFNDKRILVLGNPKRGGAKQAGHWNTMLDVVLGETCFERVARTGIAVSVWENFEGGMVAKQGGVIAGRVRVYMMQFKNEADAAYTYSIVGKLRY